jgi:hypothetical protein
MKIGVGIGHTANGGKFPSKGHEKTVRASTSPISWWKSAWPPRKSNVDCSHMMIDDDTLKQLLRINDELFQLCKWLNEKRDTEISSRLIPLVDDLTHILIEAARINSTRGNDDAAIQRVLHRRQCAAGSSVIDRSRKVRTLANRHRPALSCFLPTNEPHACECSSSRNLLCR